MGQIVASIAASTITNMYYYDQDLGTDKIMWDSRKERNTVDSIVSTVNHIPFDHAAYYEYFRNEFAIATGKAYENDTKNRIGHECTALLHVHTLYTQGLRTEDEFKKYARKAYSDVQALLQAERDAITV